MIKSFGRAKSRKTDDYVKRIDSFLNTKQDEIAGLTEMIMPEKIELIEQLSMLQ